MKLFLHVYAILALLSPITLHAQATVRGTVTDQRTGSPIAGAALYVRGTNVRTTADSSGSFTLRSARAITMVRAYAAGYATRDVKVTDPSEPLDVRLAPEATELPGVQVVGSAAAPSTGVLTRHDLERSTGLSLESSINTLPGVFMQSRTPWGGARITIRGYYPSTSGNSPNSNGLGYQVFLDDIPLTDATGTTILDDVDYSALGNVEVIKGPASSQYGSFIGGAVRLTTVRPTPGERSVSQEVMGGSDGLLRTNTTFQTADSTSDLLLDYGHQEYDSFRPHSGSRKEYLRGSADFSVGSGQTLSTYASYNRSFEELAGEIDSTDFYDRRPVSNAAYLANDSHIDITSFVAGATDRIRIGDGFTNQTTVFGSARTSNQPFAHGFTDNNQFNFGVRSAFGYTGRLGERVGVTGTLGGMVQRSNLATNGVFIVPAPPFPQRPTTQQNFAVNASIFTEWSFALPGRVTLTAGGSLNRNRFGIRNLLKDNQVNDTTRLMTKSFDWLFTPRIAVSRELGGKGAIYASISSGYAPPLLSDAIASDGTVNLSLRPERAVQYEIGTNVSLLGNRLSGQAALFDVENTDKLVTQTSGSVQFTTNAGKQRNRGAEVALSYLAVDSPDGPLAAVRPWVSYSFTEARFIDFESDNNDNATTVNYSGNAVPRVPRNAFSAGLDVAARNGLYMNGTYQYVGTAPVTFDNSTSVRSYDLLDAKLGARRQVAGNWLLDVSAGGQNLMGSTHYNFLFVGPNYAGLAQSQDGGHGDGYIIPGAYNATFYGSVGLTYRF